MSPTENPTAVTPFVVSEQTMRSVLAQLVAAAPDCCCEFQIQIEQCPPRELSAHEKELFTATEQAALFEPKFKLVTYARRNKEEPIYSFADVDAGFDLARFIDCAVKKMPTKEEINAQRIEKIAELRRQVEALESELLPEAVG